MLLNIMSGGLQQLITWLEEIQVDKEPQIPFNLHKLVRLFHENLGPEESIKLLKQLQNYSE